MNPRSWTSEGELVHASAAVLTGAGHSWLPVLSKGLVYSKRIPSPSPMGVWFPSVTGLCWELSFEFWLLYQQTLLANCVFV